MIAPASPDAFASAHALLAERMAGRSEQRDEPGAALENPAEPGTVQAMQLVLNVPKQTPPARNLTLCHAARAVVAVCLDERAGCEGFWRDGLDRWYSHRIRKVARRARNTPWEDVQALPGVTVGGADAAGAVRAFVPSAVGEVPHAIAKLQIRGTELDDAPELPPLDGRAPTLVVDASLGMSGGKAAAQVGHASMLYAAALPVERARAWASEGFSVNVREVAADEFAALAGCEGAVHVRDAGFTEVAPGSTTVLALPPEAYQAA